MRQAEGTKYRSPGPIHTQNQRLTLAPWNAGGPPALGRKITVALNNSFVPIKRIPDEGLDTAHLGFRTWHRRPCTGDLHLSARPGRPARREYRDQGPNGRREA